MICTIAPPWASRLQEPQQFMPVLSIES